MPEITILMPAYNCEPYIAEAIQSVLNQTFTDFELIILDDGSTDNTPSVISQFHDPRIIVQRYEHDYIATLNRGLECATGRYLARMDADDLIPATRLAIQHTILEEHPAIDVCSGWMQLFGENIHEQLSQTVSGYIDHPLLFMLKTNFVYNATTMCRMSLIRKHRLQYKYYPYAEDFMFWSEAARMGAKFFIESQVLYYYRMHKNQVSLKHKNEQVESSWKIRKEVVKWLVEEFSNKQVSAFYKQTCELNQSGLLSDTAFNALFYHLFCRIINSTNPIETFEKRI